MQTCVSVTSLPLLRWELKRIVVVYVGCHIYILYVKGMLGVWIWLCMVCYLVWWKLIGRTHKSWMLHCSSVVYLSHPYSIYLVHLCAFLLGFGDSIFNTQVSVVCCCGTCVCVCVCVCVWRTCMCVYAVPFIVVPFAFDSRCILWLVFCTQLMI